MKLKFDEWRHRLATDPLLPLLGGIVLLITLFIYGRTVQPTVPFWDCGEFIACSHILGVPHPPGTPLFVLIGRIFAMLPLAADPSLRINLLSSISGALAAMLAFFILSRIITKWFADEYPSRNLSMAQRLAVYSGSFSGALLFAFGATNWSNSVEAEVYSLSMFLILALLWLTLLWEERREQPAGDRFLIALSFVAMASIGIHMTVFLVMPPIFLAVVLLSQRLRRDWRFWATGFVLALIMLGVSQFFWGMAIWIAVTGLMAGYRRWSYAGWIWTAVVWGLGLALSVGRAEPWPIFLAALIWGLGIMPWVIRSVAWGLPCAMLVAGLLGYSTHLYIPIRANLNPTINENDPRSWTAFSGFLERKQYGSQSMFERALKRRGEWANQLGQHSRMGFWGFFDRQYGYNDRAFLPLFVLGLIGTGVALRRRKITGLLLLALLLISSVGLVWYMNFADGTRYNPATQDAYLEVRDRDYFFLPAFMLFGMAVGLGGAAVVRWLGGATRSVVLPALGALLVAVMPLRTIQANYFACDRSNNYIPYDYAHNILASADSSAVLFTNGDNDTFPVWCLQTVYGVRTDVRIVNLSLANTHWYIKQLKDFHDVPIDLTDEQIDRLVHYRDPDGTLHRIQDQMIDVILSSNRGKYPINFSVTVTPANRKFRNQSIEEHLRMVGMAYRLVPESGSQSVDVDLLAHRLLNVYQFRGIDDPSVYKDETSGRMVQNYISGFFMVADSLRRGGDLEGSVEMMRHAIRLFEHQWEPYVYLSQLYTDLRDSSGLDQLLTAALGSVDDEVRVRLNIAYAFRRMQEHTRAEAIMTDTYSEYPDDESAFRALAQFYYDNQRFDTLLGIIEGWMASNPADSATQELYARAQDVANERAAQGVQTPPPDTLLP